MVVDFSTSFSSNKEPVTAEISKEMEVKEVIEILESHNKWRRGSDDVEPTNPKLLGMAIDRAVEELRSCNVVKHEDIIKILQLHSYNVEDQAGNHIIVVDEDSFDSLATELKNCSIPNVSSRFIYLITNETDRIVESSWCNFEEAKKECHQLEKMKPQKQFMVVELPINGR